jgi:hypothetical protein
MKNSRSLLNSEVKSGFTLTLSRSSIADLSCAYSLIRRVNGSSVIVFLPPYLLGINKDPKIEGINDVNLYKDLDTYGAMSTEASDMYPLLEALFELVLCDP